MITPFAYALEREDGTFFFIKDQEEAESCFRTNEFVAKIALYQVEP